MLLPLQMYSPEFSFAARIISITALFDSTSAGDSNPLKTKGQISSGSNVKALLAGQSGDKKNRSDGEKIFRVFVVNRCIIYLIRFRYV